MSHTQRRYDRDRDRRQARDERDATRRSRCCRSSSVAKRIGWAVGTCGIIALVVSMTTLSGPKRSPAPDRLDAMSAKRVTEYVADNGIVGAALAAERAVAVRDDRPLPQFVSVNAIPSRPRPGTDASTLRFAGVRSRDAHLTTDAATTDAIEQARELIVKQLERLDPPVTRRPSFEAVRAKYVVPNSAVTVQPPDDLKAEWAKAKLETNRVWVQVDVEVSAEQVRQLRGEERMIAVARIVGVLVFVLAGLAGFFRLDALTKGHLTVALGVGLALLGTLGTAGLVYVVRGDASESPDQTATLLEAPPQPPTPVSPNR